MECNFSFSFYFSLSLSLFHSHFLYVDEEGTIFSLFPFLFFSFILSILLLLLLFLYVYSPAGEYMYILYINPFESIAFIQFLFCLVLGLCTLSLSLFYVQYSRWSLVQSAASLANITSLYCFCSVFYSVDSLI